MSTTLGDQGRGSLLSDLCQELFGDRRLIVASNRGPVEHYVGPDGDIQGRRGGGGVVTALSGVTRFAKFSWVASAMGEGDRRVAYRAGSASVLSSLPDQNLLLRFIVTPRRVYHKYYNVICNPLLWFLQHYLWAPSYTPTVDRAIHDAWTSGYVPVNEAFAEAIAHEAETDSCPPYVMLHDYHLYLTPLMLRRLLPRAILHHFVHVPWPSTVYWQLLPRSMRTAIIQGVCANDIVGFQTKRDVLSFLQSADEFLEDSDVDYRQETITFEGHQTFVRAYPISIDVGQMEKIASSAQAKQYEKQLRRFCNQQTVIRVDRAEPSKNIVRGFQAYHLLLTRYPELQTRVNFLAFLVPSRTNIRQYQMYQQAIDEQVKDINEAFGTDQWQPVRVFYENNYHQAIAAMKLYDVLLVNPVIDGMNLVSKEGPIVNTRSGVLILSEAAGAYEELKEGALPVAPADIEGTAEVLYQALTMSWVERRKRADILVNKIRERDLSYWFCSQLEDLRSLIPA